MISGRAVLAAVCAVLALLAAPAAAFPGFSASDSGSVYPDSADGSRAAHPNVRAYRLDGQDIHLDGRLDDAAWQAAPLSLIHISEPTRLLSISYAVFCLK